MHNLRGICDRPARHNNALAAVHSNGHGWGHPGAFDCGSEPLDEFLSGLQEHGVSDG